MKRLRENWVWILGLALAVVVLVIVIVFIFVVALYALVTKKATKNELDSDDDAQDPYLTQQNIADDNQQDSEDQQE